MDYNDSKTTDRPYSYHNGPQKTVKPIGFILPKLLQQIGKRFESRPDLVLAAWPEVVGSRLASMTQATSFQEGILYVLVKNSTLYSLLNQYDKPRIIQNLRSKFPNSTIKTVLFRLG